MQTSSPTPSNTDEFIQPLEDETESLPSLSLPSIIIDSDWIESSDADSLPDEENYDSTPSTPKNTQSNQDLFDSRQSCLGSHNDYTPNLHGMLNQASRQSA